jgi:hypothetical protein
MQLFIRRALWLVISCVGLCCWVTSAGAQPDDSRDTREATVAAQAEMLEFSEVVSGENFRALGFSTPDEAKRAVLGEPIELYSVRLDELRRYDPAANPETLIRRQLQYLFPVLVAGKLRSSIEVAKVGSTWKGVRFGSPQIMRTLDGIRRTQAKELKRAPSSFFLVRVRALNVAFMGHRDGGTLWLTPIPNTTDVPLMTRRTPAATVFRLLLPAAQRHDPRAPS